MKIIITTSILLCMINFSAQQIHVSSGTLKRYENFSSKFVAARNIDVWLPDNYSSEKKYAVLYMHDGQSLFDSTTTWNHQEWSVDETMAKLMKENKIKDCIVVAVWNVPRQRFADYFPQKIIDSIPEPTRTTILTKQINGRPSADNYLRFLVTELKPFIDSVYSTNKDVSNTFIMGSSMGGLISAYALCEYPDIFGGAACLSTHSPLAAPDLINDSTDINVAGKFRDYLYAHLPKANTRKIYFDYGDRTLDSLYKPYQIAIDALMDKKGWKDAYWETKFFPGENHSETSWAKRLDIPVLFLLRK